MSAISCLECSSPITADTRFCPNCGKPTMDSSLQRFERLRRLYEEARGIDVSRRSEWVERVCSGDESLRDQLLGMLAVGTDSREAPPASRPGMVGPYRLVRELGRGGMGIVYLAVRDDGAFRKNVALKVLLRDQVSSEFVARFKQERQVLAAIDHPNIARILDGGDMPDGTPYYVMEYVEGLPIDKYCDQQRLSLTARIKLFQQVCNAVHYLHQNLIVHRDLKPSNIQIGPDGTVKLLDFGIAKMIGAAAVQAPDLTVGGGSPMTPSYASPEQIAGATLQKPSDIYSLGVILYGLLTGRTPYQGLDEKIAGIASRRPPPPPSGNIREDLRSSDSTAQLRRALLGELDSIVLMALNVDPSQRYQSAGDFARDLQQFLDGLPVAAHHSNVASRSVKLLKRRRLLLAAVACIILLSGVAFWQWRRADVHTTEIAEKEMRLRKVLDELESGLEPSVAATQTPEIRVNNVKKLQQALRTDYASLAARTKENAPERDALLARGVRYLDRLYAAHPKETRLGLEIASTYHQVGTLQENTLPKGQETNVVVINTYEKAVVILVGIGPEAAEAELAKNKLLAINSRIVALGGIVAPASNVVARRIVPKLNTIRSTPGQEDPPVEEPKEEPPRSNTVAPAELAEKLATVASKVEIAKQAIEPIRVNLENSGQKLNSDTSSAMQRMQSSLASARRMIEEGDFAGANQNLAAADAFASRVLRTVGR